MKGWNDRTGEAQASPFSHLNTGMKAKLTGPFAVTDPRHAHLILKALSRNNSRRAAWPEGAAIALLVRLGLA